MGKVGYVGEWGTGNTWISVSEEIGFYFDIV